SLRRCQHGMAEVTPDHLSSRTCLQREHQIACAAAEIDDRCILAMEYGLQALHSARTPMTIDVERQQVIQQIITGRDAPEHVAHPCGGFLLRGSPARRSAAHASAAWIARNT